MKLLITRQLVCTLSLTWYLDKSNHIWKSLSSLLMGLMEAKQGQWLWDRYALEYHTKTVINFRDVFCETSVHLEATHECFSIIISRDFNDFCGQLMKNYEQVARVCGQRSDPHPIKLLITPDATSYHPRRNFSSAPTYSISQHPWPT